MVPGTQVDRYVVEALLGEGGMARVYRVRHARLGSVHAMKVLQPALLERAGAAERFVTEGRLQASLRHPNLVAVTDVAEAPGIVGLIMEYVQGESMADLIARMHGPASPELIRDLFGQILAGIGHAHRHGVVHRDLKPDNVLLDWFVGGRPFVRICDFGIAKVFEGFPRLTLAGSALGTPSYMSPEQIQNPAQVTGRSDIFSLGATLYELATGKLAFDGETPFVIQSKIVRGDYPPPEKLCPALPQEIAAAIRRSLAIDPAERFGSCEEFAAALQPPAVEHLGVPPAPRERQKPPPIPDDALREQPTPVRGEDVTVRLDLELAEAVHGAEKVVNVSRTLTCEACDGKGFDREAGEQCHTCFGRGGIPCWDAVSVTVPAGVDTGTQLRLKGMGSEGLSGGPNGDAYVNVRVLPHPTLTRDGDHLRTTVSLTPRQAVGGAEIVLETLDGDVKVEVPALTRHGSLLRVAGLGVPRRGGEGRGDLFIRVEVATGPSDSERFQVSLDGRTVLDRQQGLVWEREPPAQPLEWSEALARAASLDLPGDGWRLPARGELESLVETQWRPTIDPGAFPGTVESTYWTATRDEEAGHVVSFAEGVTQHEFGDGPHFLRCVRAMSLSERVGKLFE